MAETRVLLVSAPTLQINGRDGSEEHLAARWTHQDLDGEQAFSSVPCVDGELHGQTGPDPGGVQARTAGPDFAGVMSREGLDLKGTEERQVDGSHLVLEVSPGQQSVRDKPPRNLLVGVFHAHRVRPVAGRGVVNRVGTVSIVCEAERLGHTWAQNELHQSAPGSNLLGLIRTNSTKMEQIREGKPISVTRGPS